MMNELADRLRETLPPIVPRSHLKKYGWPYSERYMANIDSDKTKTGPNRIRCGAKVIYVRDDQNGLIDWLLNRFDTGEDLK